MTKLSKTDIENLNLLVAAHGALSVVNLKGHGDGIRKIERLGFITRHVFKGHYWMQITALGRKEVAA